MIVLWILLALALLLALLLSLPLQIALRVTPEGGFSYRVKYAFLTLADSEAEKKEPTEKKPEGKRSPAKQDGSGAKKVLLNFLGLGDLAGADEAKRAIREKGLLQTLQGISEAASSLLRRLLRLLSRGVFRRFTLRISVGGDDPADTALRYGTFCAALYPLLSLLGERMRFRRRRVEVLCDYDSAQTQVFFDALLTYRPWHILHLFCGLVRNYLKTKKERPT